MTDRPAPTDAELLNVWEQYVGEPSDRHPLTDADKVEFARAVLAKWGTPPPAVAREPETPEFVALGQFLMACKDQQMSGAALLEAMRWLATHGIKEK